MANLVNASTPILKVVIVGISLVGLVLGAVFLSSRTNSVEEGSAMDVATNMTPRAAIPPIDASAPAQTETATFALG
jgi:hypothetical protein